MSMRVFRLKYNRALFYRPILSEILNFKGSKLEERSNVYTNDESNRQQISKIKEEHHTEHHLRFADRSITYREYKFNYPQTGHGLVQELQPIAPMGIWSADALKELFEPSQDQIASRKMQAEFRKDTDELIKRAKAMYPNKIDKKNEGDQNRRGRQTISIDELRKMPDQKFKLFKKNINKTGNWSSHTTRNKE